MTQPLLAVRGVKTYYGNIIALKGVDIDVADGEIVTLIGANGAGKSTLMMTIFGNPRARGLDRVRWAGHQQAADHEIARLRIAQSPEGRRIFSRMTVLENLQMGAVVAGDANFAGDLERMFTLFPRLKQRLHQRGGTLSGGEQQMLAIARALMARPRLLLLDEPSLGLAPLIVRQIFDAIRELNRTEKLTVFLVEQNAFHALKLAHRGYVMVNGVITLSGTGKELLERPEVKAAYLEGGRQDGRRSRKVLGGFMSGIIYEEEYIGLFLLVTAFMGGGAAWLAGPGDRVDLAAVVACGGLHADPRRRRAVHPFRAVRGHAAVAAILRSRHGRLPDLRLSRLPGDPGRADDHAVLLDQHAGGVLALAAGREAERRPNRGDGFRIRVTFGQFSASIRQRAVVSASAGPPCAVS